MFYIYYSTPFIYTCSSKYYICTQFDDEHIHDFHSNQVESISSTTSTVNTNSTPLKEVTLPPRVFASSSPKPYVNDSEDTDSIDIKTAKTVRVIECCAT